MKTPAQLIRATVDKLNKSAAKSPFVPKKTDRRMADELVNTSANARAMAKMNVKSGQVGATEPLSALIKKARKATY